MYAGVEHVGQEKVEEGKENDRNENKTRRSGSISDSLYASTILSIEEENRRQKKTLNDQQWVLQRKKIGLSRKAAKTLQAKIHQERSKMSAITYIETHFNRKECVNYVHNEVPSHPVKNPCFCGAEKSDHKSRAEHKLDDVNYKEFRGDLILEEIAEEAKAEEDSGISNSDVSFVVLFQVI